jgi:hypothetical protein
MEPNDWTPPPMAVPPNAPWTPKRRRGVATGAALVGVGVVAGAIVGATVLAGAATTNPSAAPNASSSQQEGMHGDGHGPGRGGLGLTGTVTAVGSSSVTIKTSTATTTYQVDGNSDIDKNGEAKLSDLKVGDAVRFNVTSSNVIDKLHAGDEALDRPQGPPPGQGSGG